ncbi:MAG: NADH-quinone oxidoreductase subunit N [Myxococcota bacterium]|jgi:NADH-quinone oxidoreductase subunit N
MLNDLIATLPLGIVAVMGCFVLLLDAFSPADDRRYLGYISSLGMVAALASCYLLWGRESSDFTSAAFGTMLVMGDFEVAACALLAAIGLGVSLMSVESAEENGFGHGEYYALLNFAVFGMMVLATSTNLVSLFVGLEVMSVSVYILAAIKRSSAFGAEAGMKYFILGAFSTGFLVYGTAFIYGATVRFDYVGISSALVAGTPSGYLAIGIIMLVTAFGFKLALAPFHMWTPDVYEGAPAPVTALMATGVKTAGVLAFGRILVTAFPPATLGWIGADLFKVLGFIAILTMTIGNLAALHQKNLQRMLAYSSVAHAGYLLIGLMAAHVSSDEVLAGSGEALGGVLFYLFVYALANLAAFAVISMLARKDNDDITLDSVSGLATSHPIAAVVLAVGMFSLAGIPPTGGFFGKLALFRDALAVDAALEQQYFLWLVIIAMLNSVISVYYYLRVVVYAYMREPVRVVKPLSGRSFGAVFALTALGSLAVGILPGKPMTAATDAARGVLPGFKTPMIWDAPSTPPATADTPTLAVVDEQLASAESPD